MLANATNLRSAGVMLRAISAKASWSPGVFVNARELAKEKGLFATDEGLAAAEAYLVGQGWLVADEEEGRKGSYALTRHGLEEAQRKVPAEPKAYKPADRD
jgi:hypothetical protein